MNGGLAKGDAHKDAQGPRSVIRVLHFVSQLKVSDFFEGLARHTDRMRFDLAVCTLDGSGLLQGRLAAHGVRGFSLDCPRRAAYPIALSRLIRLLRRERFDILHTHLFDPSAIGQVAGLLARTPIRIMTRWHSDLHFVLRRPLHTWIDRLSAGLAHQVIAISEYTRTVLVEKEGLSPDRVRLIYPASPSTDPGAKAVERDQAIVHELGLDGNTVIGTVARLHPVKGHQTLFEAMPRVLATNPRVKLLVVGEGPLHERLTVMAQALGIGHAVLFLGFRPDIDRLYSVMDVMVHPALEEAFGLVVVEAMRREIPLVCTPRGVAAEIVRHGENGLVVPPAESAPMAEAIIALISSPDLRRRLGKAARETVEVRFSSLAMTKAYEECYLDTLYSLSGRLRNSRAPRRRVASRDRDPKRE